MADHSRHTPAEARVATRAELPAAIETLARAFYADPVWSWAFPDAERRLEQHRVVWGLVAEAALGYESAWLTGESAAVALWIPPGEPELRPADEERLEGLLAELLGDGAARVLETFERFEAAHPERELHYYLSLLGTNPDHRGRGVGMGLLAATLARIDAEGAPAFLESSNPVNTPRYERLGFSVCGEFELPEDGPTVTQMWREPGGSAAG
ncbi:MAG TPA: GNAT family N-acetyltransferase [Solirubrobacterales bacterium]|nr:GNAT family N-acetyltransferase [Solirubrobacterales bacterium]